MTWDHNSRKGHKCRQIYWDLPLFCTLIDIVYDSVVHLNLVLWWHTSLSMQYAEKYVQYKGLNNTSLLWHYPLLIYLTLWWPYTQVKSWSLTYTLACLFRYLDSSTHVDMYSVEGTIIQLGYCSMYTLWVEVAIYITTYSKTILSQTAAHSSKFNWNIFSLW